MAHLGELDAAVFIHSVKPPSGTQSWCEFSAIIHFQRAELFTWKCSCCSQTVSNQFGIRVQLTDTKLKCIQTCSVKSGTFGLFESSYSYKHSMKSFDDNPSKSKGKDILFRCLISHPSLVNSKGKSIPHTWKWQSVPEQLYDMSHFDFREMIFLLSLD